MTLEFYTTYPQYETGYVIFNILEEKSIKLQSPRMILCKPDIEKSTYIINGHEIKKQHSPDKLPIQLNEIACIYLPLGCTFVEPAVLDIFSLDKDIAIISPQKIYSNYEQISVLVRSVKYKCITNEDFFIGISVPFPIQFEFYPEFKNVI